MARASYMGFRKVSGAIPKRQSGRPGESIYNDLLKEVAKSGDTYGLDTKDKIRAKHLRATLYAATKKLGLKDVVIISQRGTAVYVYKEEQYADSEE